MRLRKLVVLALMGAYFFASSSAALAERGGRGGREPSSGPQVNFRPRGWDKGEKKGWDGKEHPPGWEKGKKKGWKKKGVDHPPGWDKGKKSK